MRASAVGEGQRGRAGRQVRVDIAVDEAGPLLCEAGPEREAEIRGRAKFDAHMGAIAGDRAGRGIIEGGTQSRTEAGIILQATEPAVDCDGRVLEVVAELRTFVTEIAERGTRGDAARSKSHAAFSADKPTVRKIVARSGEGSASVTELKAREVAISVCVLAGRRAAETHRPAWGPISQRGG